MKTFWDYQEEQEENSSKKSNKKDEEEIEKERQEILDSVSSYKTDTIRDKVAWVLNHFPETRDSDITLQLKYWETFESHIFKGGFIDPKDLYDLTRLTTISRTRATIQNEYKLFLASLVLQRDFILLRDFGYYYEILRLRRFERRSKFNRVCLR